MQRQRSHLTYRVEVQHVVNDGQSDLLQSGRLEDLLAGLSIGDVESVDLLATCKHLRFSDVEAQVLQCSDLQQNSGLKRIPNMAWYQQVKCTTAYRVQELP